MGPLLPVTGLHECHELLPVYNNIPSKWACKGPIEMAVAEPVVNMPLRDIHSTAVLLLPFNNAILGPVHYLASYMPLQAC